VVVIYVLYFLAACGCAFVGLVIGIFLGTLSAQRVHRHRYADGFAAARRHNATREKLARREGFDEGFLVGINDRKESLR
jgi:Na+/glutamate symporter